MLEKWKKYQAKEVQSGNDENGNRLITSFAKDYRTIMQSDICPSCNDFADKYQNFIKKLENMSKTATKNSGFVLKQMYDNITLHGSQCYYNNATLTDEQALQLLEKHPKGEGLFDVLPENWKDLKKKAAAPKAPATPATGDKGDVVTFFGKNFTVEQAKDLFKQAGIESKANSAKGLQDKFEKLIDVQKAALEALVSKTATPATGDTSGDGSEGANPSAGDGGNDEQPK